jgi:hypothetical protein
MWMGRCAAILLLTAASCGGGGGSGVRVNAAPTVVGDGVPDATRGLFDGALVLALDPAFEDDAGTLAFVLASSTGGDVASVEVDATARTLTWTPRRPGTATAVVRATDAGGLSAEDVATLTVTATTVIVDLEAVADATVYPDGASANGAGDHLFAGTNDSAVPEPRRALIRFDVAALAPDAIVLEASLRLVVSRQPNPGNGSSFSVHRLLRSFGEGPTDPSGNEGSGAPAQPGDATWVAAVHPDEPWATPGGDFVATPSGLGDPTVPEPDVVLVGDGLAADVEAWRDGAATHGWMVRGDESDVRTVRRFVSRTNPDVVSRPRLRLLLAVP